MANLNVYIKPWFFSVTSLSLKNMGINLCNTTKVTFPAKEGRLEYDFGFNVTIEILKTIPLAVLISIGYSDDPAKVRQIYKKVTYDELAEFKTYGVDAGAKYVFELI